jgi:hypothetical protein
MSEPTLQELRDRLSTYLTGNSSLSEFRDWFDVETWDMAAEPDSSAREVAGEIELRLAEFTNGHLSEDELRHHFEGFLPEVDFQLPVMYREPSVEMTLS